MTSSTPAGEVRPWEPPYPPPGKVAAKEEEDEYSAYTEEEETDPEEEATAPATSAKAAPSNKGSAAGHPKERSPLRRRSLGSTATRAEVAANHGKRKRKSKRGGRKHKRLYRTLAEPFKPIHRGLSKGHWDDKGREEEFSRRRHPSP